MKAAKGFRGGYGNTYRSAIEFTMRAKKFATRDRAQKKRHFRSLRITRLSAALRRRRASGVALRAQQGATRARAQKKRHFRSLWITRLSAALRERGVPYNRFIPALV